MSDLISRQAAMKEFSNFVRRSNNSDFARTPTWNDAVSLVGSMPSAEPRWIPVKERLPKDNVPVNITWINRHPEPYYKSIKDVPFTATGVYFKGKWYWYSSTVEDYLAEYGRAEWDEIDEAIEITAWMPLPEPYAERRTDEH